MNLKNFFVAGVAALAFGGCVSKLSPKAEDAIVPPSYSLEGAVREEKAYPFYAVVAQNVDRNHDKKTDLVELVVSPRLGIGFMEGPQRLLIVDSDFDGYADWTYADNSSPFLVTKADGKYDSMETAELFWQKHIIVTGRGASREDMRIENYKKALFFPEEK